jgi:hypothetical protein
MFLFIVLTKNRKKVKNNLISRSLPPSISYLIAPAKHNHYCEQSMHGFPLIKTPKAHIESYLIFALKTPQG